MADRSSGPYPNHSEEDLLEIAADVFEKLGIRIEERKRSSITGTTNPSLFSWGERVSGVIHPSPSGPLFVVTVTPVVPTNLPAYASAERLARLITDTVKQFAGRRLA